MEELFGGALILLVVALFGGGIVYLLTSFRAQRELERTPVPALTGPGDAAAKLTQYYRLMQRAVRAMEELLNRDKLVPILDAEQRGRLQSIVDDFYDL